MFATITGGALNTSLPSSVARTAACGGCSVTLVPNTANARTRICRHMSPERRRVNRFGPLATVMRSPFTTVCHLRLHRRFRLQDLERYLAPVRAFEMKESGIGEKFFARRICGIRHTKRCTSRTTDGVQKSRDGSASREAFHASRARLA